MLRLIRALGVVFLALVAAQAAAQYPDRGPPSGGYGPYPGGPGMFPGGPGMYPGGPGMFPGGPGMFPGGPGPSPDWERFRSMRRDGGDPRFGGGRDSGGSSGRQDDRAQRYEAFLRQFDANGDGMISPNEVSGSRRPLYEGIVRRAGMDPSGTLSVQALRDALSQRSSSRSGPSNGTPDAGGKPNNDASKGTASLVPGFGPPGQASTVLGFGSPATARPAAGSSSGSGASATAAPTSTTPSPSSSGSSVSASPAASTSPSSSGSSGNNRPDDRVRRYAEALLRQYDKNKNNILEKDEWSQMKSTWKDSDANGDGVITVDELAAKMGSFSRSRSTPSSSSSGNTAMAASGGNSSSTSKKSYRFLSPHERLPGGLPDWFLRKDADADGQVTMAEYSRSGWSDSMAEEFVKQDRNGDGIVTPEECLKSASGK